jgi:hypothetical protein
LVTQARHQRADAVGGGAIAFDKSLILFHVEIPFYDKTKSISATTAMARLAMVDMMTSSRFGQWNFFLFSRNNK